MFAKGKLERDASLLLPRWVLATETLCWVLLVAIFTYTLLR